MRPMIYSVLAITVLSGAGAFALMRRPSRPAPVAQAAPIEQGAQAPLSMRLEQTPGSEDEFAVTIEARATIPFPMRLKATLPRGASLVSGSLDEELRVAQGSTTRLLKVRLTDPLSASNPLRVELHGEAADRSAGLHAERVLPAPLPAQPPPFQRAPGGRPMAPVKP